MVENFPDLESSINIPVDIFSGECTSPRLALCRGILPYDLTLSPTAAPGLPGVRAGSAADLAAAMPYFDLVATSKCSLRVLHFLCPLLEPECVPPNAVPRRPCRRLCRGETLT